MQVMFDAEYRLRDIYYPYVGKENHTAGHAFRFGVFTEGLLSWTDSSEWERRLSYAPDTLVTAVELLNRRREIRLECRDAVDLHENIYLREIVVHNLSSRQREIVLFFHQDFYLYGISIADTALYDPRLEAILHYKGHRYFLINVQVEDRVGVKEWAIGTKELGGAEGTWRDAEDGRLGMNPIAQGSVDSTISARMQLAAAGKTECYYWIVAGDRFRDVKSLNETVLNRTPAQLLLRTENYWRLWASKNQSDLAELPQDISQLYTRSLLILRSLTDNHGGVIAANDSDLLRFGDTYSYVWPRDGARAAFAFGHAGYIETPRAFFKFCADILTEEGYLLHKYNPDGSFGSSWHPWYAHQQLQLPIQEDGLGLVLWAFWQTFAGHRDLDCVKELYYQLIVRSADFLESYRTPATGLPRPSYDLWEERYGIHTFTVATVYGGLLAAANFAECFGEHDAATRYKNAAVTLQEAAQRILFSTEAKRFARSLDPYTGQLDLTVDASLFGVFAFGLLPPEHPMVISTMKAVEERLAVQTPIGGVARYERDSFCHVTEDCARVPGNPWIVCTLWLAQYKIATARTQEELHAAAEMLHWVTKHARPTGVLPEQLHPFGEGAVSVCPLAWSHAEFVITVSDYVAKRNLLRKDEP